MRTNRTTAVPRDPPTMLNYDGRPAPFDTNRLVARCMGNCSFALLLLSELERTAEQRIGELGNHAVRRDFQLTADSAHSLKGAFAVLGADALQDVAARIESASLAGDIGSVAALVEELRVEMSRCLSHLPQVRDKLLRNGEVPVRATDAGRD